MTDPDRPDDDFVPGVGDPVAESLKHGSNEIMRALPGGELRAEDVCDIAHDDRGGVVIHARDGRRYERVDATRVLRIRPLGDGLEERTTFRRRHRLDTPKTLPEGFD